MKLKLIIAGVLSCMTAMPCMAQENLIYNHYYLNPFLYNPSMIAPNGYSELYVNYRKQWSGIEGAPETGTLNLHLPLSYKSGVAFTAFKDQAGLLKTTTGMVSFAYQIYLGKSITDLHKIGFGLSAGVTNSRIDASEDIQDPVLGNNTSTLDGQFGIHYQYNRFRVGFAIPRLFDSRVASEDQFSKPGITQINNIIASMGYEFRVGTGFAFEPIVTYRTYQNLDPQVEVLGNFKIGQIAWVGGSYRQDYGAIGFLGVNIKEKVKIAYAYEIATEQSDRLGNGSHEVQLVLRLGKKKFTRPTATGKTTATPAPTTPVQVEEKPVEKAAEQPQEQPVSEAPQQEPAQQVTQPVVTEQKIAPVQQPVQAEQVAPEVSQKPVTKLNGEGLAPGHYVVVGAFQSVANAKNYEGILKRAGYPASVAYHPEKGYYIVHMSQAPTVEEARVLRDKYRQMSRYSFRDTWILSIE